MSTTSTTAAKAENSIGQVQFLTITALFIALTYVFTAFVNVRLPITANGGLIHLGNVPLFIGAILFGKKTGAGNGFRMRTGKTLNKKTVRLRAV